MLLVKVVEEGVEEELRPLLELKIGRSLLSVWTGEACDAIRFLFCLQKKTSHPTPMPASTAPPTPRPAIERRKFTIFSRH